MSQVIASQAIAGQTIFGWTIRDAALVKAEVVLEWEKNNSSIDEKPLNLVGTKEESQCRKSQTLAYLLLVVNQSTSAAKGA